MVNNRLVIIYAGLTALGMANARATTSVSRQSAVIPDNTEISDAAADSIVARSLDEFVVTGSSAQQRIDNPRLGAEHLELSKLTAVPSLGGENDIIKSLALLPGVRSEGDGGGGFEVRGGNSTQNLMLLDGITLYNPSHVMGIFSTFNDNAISSATLYKGPIPATFGNVSSSVLETTLAPGDMENFHASGTVGILSAKIYAEGPIVKDKLSFAVAARRSYVDVFLKIIPKFRTTVMNFYDASAKFRYCPSSSHIIDGSFFIGHDNMAVGDVMGMYWGNIGASVNWMARAGEKFSFTSVASLTHTDPRMEMIAMDDEQIMHTYIHNYSLNEKIRYMISQSHSLEFGVRSELLRVKSAEWTFGASREFEIRSLWDNSAWIDYNAEFDDKFDLGIGVRMDVSSVMGGHRFHRYQSVGNEPNQFDSKTYFDISPRVNMKYNITPQHNIKIGVGMSSQNLHSIRSSATSFPFDRVALTSALVKPERSTQYGIGYNGMTDNGDYDWSVEGYYRNMSNVYDFKDGRGTFSDIALESIILGGRGRSFGAEFMLRKNSGRLTGWISYTISHTQTKIPGINNGKWYNATNDRCHDISVAAIYKLSDKWDFSASWIFLSGHPLTAPDVKYEIGGETVYYYSARNSYKTPPTHRLDLSATYTHRGDKFTYEWAFGVYNAYCRYNPYLIYFQDDPSKPSGTRAVLQSMYGLIPSVSYTLKF